MSSPELVKHVVKDAKDDFPKDNWSYSFFQPILGEGLVTASGPKWRKQNEVLKPKFKHAALRQYMRAFTSAARRLVDDWKALPPGATVELDSTFRRVTLEVISEVTLGLTPSDASVLPALFSGIIDELNTRLWEPWRAFMPVELHHQRRIAELDALVLALIHARRDEYKEAGGVPPGRSVLSDEAVLAAGSKLDDAPRGGDFLDIMLQSDVSFTDREMMDQLKTMLMAGHETSAMMLSWCTFLIVRSPEATRKAVAEIDEAWSASGSSGEVLDWAGVNRLTAETAPDGSAQDTYVHWALHEAMRLFTPVPMLAKTTTQPRAFAGSTIPAGTKVMVCCVALHSDESIWGEDVGEFRPERHNRRTMPASLRKVYPYAFVPFSVGQRECIGRRLALIEAKTILAYILRHFSFALAPGQTSSPVTDSYMIPLRPEGGLRLTVTPRAH